jgi:tetratricopeptide (TPR) repeat protein
MGLGGLSLDEGKWEQASAFVVDALAIARRGGQLWALRAGELVLAQLDLIEGRPELARERLEPFLDRPEFEEWQVTEMLPTLAAAYEGSGDLGQAEHTIQEAIRRAAASNNTVSLASALVVRGRLMVGQGDWAAAERDLEEAVRLARDMPYPYLEARGLFERGIMCEKKGDSEKARECLNEALAIFQRLGAQPFIDRTEHALAALR